MDAAKGSAAWRGRGWTDRTRACDPRAWDGERAEPGATPAPCRVRPNSASTWPLSCAASISATRSCRARPPPGRRRLAAWPV